MFKTFGVYFLKTRNFGMVRLCFKAPPHLRVSEVKGRNTFNDGGFFSEDSAIWLPGEFLRTEHI